MRCFVLRTPGWRQHYRHRYFVPGTFDLDYTQAHGRLRHVLVLYGNARRPFTGSESLPSRLAQEPSFGRQAYCARCHAVEMYSTNTGFLNSLDIWVSSILLELFVSVPPSRAVWHAVCSVVGVTDADAIVIHLGLFSFPGSRFRKLQKLNKSVRRTRERTQ